MKKTERLKIADIKKIAKEHGFEVLNDKYSNNKTKLMISCKNGHKYERSWYIFSKRFSKIKEN